MFRISLQLKTDEFMQLIITFFVSYCIILIDVLCGNRNLFSYDFKASRQCVTVFLSEQTYVFVHVLQQIYHEMYLHILAIHYAVM